MTDMLQIQPVQALRREFARWAVAQTPKVRTTSTHHFAVPPHQFVDMPEALLIGALVDGHRYVSPDEDAAAGRPAPGTPRLLDCGLCFEEDGQEVHPHPECTADTGTPEPPGATTPEAVIPPQQQVEFEATPGDVLPEVPASAYGPDSVPLVPAEAEDNTTAANPAGGGAGDDNGQAGPLTCPDCSRTFTTARGRDSHRRQIHPEA
ncbi:hypothetical protein ACFRQM_09230 [Streptomyces sp. NPDC056831]|uniref:hypothetical protein n=1 Tax=Streptomyces sp. NPDC056831 TaxID=3345954 RepID=UPI003676F3EE